MKNNYLDKSISKNDKNAIVKNAIKPFLLMTFFAVIFANIILYIYNKTEIEAYKDIEKHSVEMPVMSIKHHIRNISSDVFILANQKHISDLWDENKIINQKYFHQLSENFLAMSKFKKKYDQIRLIDNNGLETIRINFNNDSPYIVSKEKLQNKKGRYYFDDTLNLQKDEIFISPLDLNIEQGEVEQPHKPMIRVATPIFNENDEKSGIVLLNYFGTDLIEHVKNHLNALKKDNLMLLNSDGYWLCGINADDEWGFMFEDKKNRTFANRYPEAWKTIHSQKSGQFQTPAGVFTFETIFPLAEGQISSTGSSKVFSPSLSKLNSKEYYWKIVSFLPTSYFKSNHNKRLLIAIYSLIIISGLFLYISILFSIHRFHRRVAEAKIKESESNLRQIIDLVPHFIFVKDEDGKDLIVNKAVADAYGTTVADIIGKSDIDTSPDKESVAKFIADDMEVINSGKRKFIPEEFITDSKGNIRFLETIKIPFKTSLTNKHTILGVSVDITERKQAKEQIQKDLKIKNALIQEIYHRTKNNMSVISAMLSIQSNRSKNDYVKSTFREINNKIQAMSLVQQKLYEAKDLSNISLKDYITDLANLMSKSYGYQSENIKFRFELQEIKVIIDLAVPLGLIINELVSNIFKHAFPSNQKGEIFIRLFKTENETINLELIDNGIGFPQNFNPRKDASMGLVLVYSIVENQLKGEISVKSKNGLRWHIKIKNNKIKERI